MNRESFYKNKELIECMRVIQFVEISAIHLDLVAHRARIPKDIFDENAPKTIMDAHFNIFYPDTDIVRESKELLKKITEIRRKYCINIKKYGNLIAVDKKDSLIKDIDKLNKEIDIFKTENGKNIIAAYENALNEMMKYLSIIEGKGRGYTPPYSASNLEYRLRETMGNPVEYINYMGIKVVYKNITSEMLEDDEFVEKIFSSSKLRNILKNTIFYNRNRRIFRVCSKACGRSVPLTVV